jgi:hypothetical protein
MRAGSGPEVGAGFGGYSSDAGKSPSRQQDQVPARAEVQATGPPVLPLHRAFGTRSLIKHRLRGLPMIVLCGTAHPSTIQFGSCNPGDTDVGLRDGSTVSQRR